MTQLVDWIYAAARPWVAYVLLGVALVFTFVLFPMKHKKYPPCYKDASGKETAFKTFDGSWWYTPAEARAKLEALGAEGRAVYRSQEIQLDLIFPLVYCFLLAFGFALLAPGTHLPRWIVIVPFIAALADYGEDFSALAMIARFEKGTAIDSIALIGSLFTLTKQVLAYGSFIVVAALAIAAWLRR
jgi:hypothetical protein